MDDVTCNQKGTWIWDGILVGVVSPQLFPDGDSLLADLSSEEIR